MKKNFGPSAKNGRKWTFLAVRGPKNEIFFFKISKFRFSQSVRISECIADVVSFFSVLPPKWPKMVKNGQKWPKTDIFGCQGAPKMRFFSTKFQNSVLAKVLELKSV